MFKKTYTNNIINLNIFIISKNGQVNQQASADRPVSSLLGLVRTLQLVITTCLNPYPC